MLLDNSTDYPEVELTTYPGIQTKLADIIEKAEIFFADLIAEHNIDK